MAIGYKPSRSLYRYYSVLSVLSILHSINMNIYTFIRDLCYGLYLDVYSPTHCLMLHECVPGGGGETGIQEPNKMLVP